MPLTGRVYQWLDPDYTSTLLTCTRGSCRPSGSRLEILSESRKPVTATGSGGTPDAASHVPAGQTSAICQSRPPPVANLTNRIPII